MPTMESYPLVGRAFVIERVLQMLPDLGTDLGGTRHGRLALRRRCAHKLSILEVHLDRGAGARRGDVPEGSRDHCVIVRP